MVIIDDEMKEIITYTNDDTWWTKISETGFKLPATPKESPCRRGVKHCRNYTMVKNKLRRFMTDMPDPTPTKTPPSRMSDMNFISFKGM